MLHGLEPSADAAIVGVRSTALRAGDPARLAPCDLRVTCNDLKWLHILVPLSLLPTHPAPTAGRGIRRPRARWRGGGGGGLRGGGGEGSEEEGAIGEGGRGASFKRALGAPSP